MFVYTLSDIIGLIVLGLIILVFLIWLAVIGISALVQWLQSIPKRRRRKFIISSMVHLGYQYNTTLAQFENDSYICNYDEIETRLKHLDIRELQSIIKDLENNAL